VFNPQTLHTSYLSPLPSIVHAPTPSPVWPFIFAPQSAQVPPCPVSVQCAVACARAARCSPPSPLARTCHVPWLAQVSPAPPSASPHSDATHVPLRSTARLPRRRRPLMPCAVALDCASLGVAALSCRVPLRSTCAVALDCASLGVAALSSRVGPAVCRCARLRLLLLMLLHKNAHACRTKDVARISRGLMGKWGGESGLRSTLGALVGLATILRRRSARPHEDIVPHQTFG